MKNLSTSTLLLSLCFASCVHSGKKDLGKQKLVEDFQVFQSIFEQANAGLYKYHSKHEIDSVFSTNQQLITDKTSYRDFYNILWNVIDFTGSCHNDLFLPDSLDEFISSQKIFFPLPLRFLHNALYANLAYKNIPLGAQITAVNGIPALEFANNVSKYCATDGHNTSGKYNSMEFDFLPFHIFFAYGEQSHFNIDYIDNGVIKKTVIEAIDYAQFKSNHKKRFVPKYETFEEDYTFSYIDSIKTGLLSVNTFSLGEPNSAQQKKYARFIDSVFIDLKQKKIKNIIVDVRNNEGGSDPNDLLLYSYLTNRNFKESLSIFTTFNTIPLKNFFKRKERIAHIEEELKTDQTNFIQGRYYRSDSLNPEWKPNPNAFTGKVYLLISPLVASAGSLFASMVKSDDNPIVIGQETLGGYYGHTGKIPVSYRLPHSKFEVNFSLVDLKQDVKKLPDENWGDGVKPDYFIEPGINEYLHNEDVAMEFAKSMIRQEK